MISVPIYNISVPDIQGVSKKSTFLKFHVLDNALRESLFLERLRSIVQNLKFQKSTLLRDTLYVYIYWP